MTKRNSGVVRRTPPPGRSDKKKHTILYSFPISAFYNLKYANFWLVNLICMAFGLIQTGDAELFLALMGAESTTKKTSNFSRFAQLRLCDPWLTNHDWLDCNQTGLTYKRPWCWLTRCDGDKNRSPTKAKFPSGCMLCVPEFFFLVELLRKP